MSNLCIVVDVTNEDIKTSGKESIQNIISIQFHLTGMFINLSISFQDWYDTWTATNTVKGRFHQQFSEHTTRHTRDMLKLPHWYSCDAVCMALVANPRAVLSSLKRYCTVEIHGSLTRGQLVVDYNGSWNKLPNVELITHLDTESVRKLLEGMLS